MMLLLIMKVYSHSRAMVLSSKRNTSHCVVEIRREGAALLRDACGAMVSQGSSAGVFNSLPWERLEVIQTQDGADKPSLGMLLVMFAE